MERFVFDFVLDRPDETTVRQLVQEDVSISKKDVERHTDNNCPFYCGALAISNLADLTQYDEREEQYKQIMKNYSEKERKTMAEIFGKIFGLLSSVVYDDGVFSDYLGEIFMNCNMGNKNTGQFFTPYHVSKMCAKIAIGTPNKADGKILTLCEPCCGSGGMVLAAMDVLKNDFGINYAMDCFVDCSDIDLRCVHMAYLQLSLACLR